MPEQTIIPSIDMRLSALLELNRRRELADELKHSAGKARPTITISREFGCEAYPMAERLRELLEKKTGESWMIMDKGLLEAVARNHNLSKNLLLSLGEKSRFLDDFMSTFSPNWKSDKDYFHLLAKQIMVFASQGKMIIVGRGSSIVTQSLKNCFHFRIFASMKFKTNSIAKRLNISITEAEEMVVKRQKQRDNFIKDFLDRDARDMSYYHLIFNNNKNSPEKMAGTIVEYVLHS
jgi:cytidylate kinase